MLRRKKHGIMAAIQGSQVQSLISFLVKQKNPEKAHAFLFMVITLCQVSAWPQSAALLPISSKSVQPVQARVEEPVAQKGNLLVVVSRIIHPFPRYPKSARERRLSKLAQLCQCAIRRRRRTRNTKKEM